MSSSIVLQYARNNGSLQILLFGGIIELLELNGDVGHFPDLAVFVLRKPSWNILASYVTISVGRWPSIAPLPLPLPLPRTGQKRLPVSR